MLTALSLTLSHIHTHSLTFTHSLSHSLTLTHSHYTFTHIHTLTHTLIHTLTFTLTFTHSHSLTHTHTLSLSLSHTHTLYALVYVNMFKVFMTFHNTKPVKNTPKRSEQLQVPKIYLQARGEGAGLAWWLRRSAGKREDAGSTPPLRLTFLVQNGD